MQGNLEYEHGTRCLGSKASSCSIELTYSKVVVWKLGAHHELDLEVDTLVDDIDATTHHVRRH
jgi:hypothetical protein